MAYSGILARCPGCGYVAGNEKNLPNSFEFQACPTCGLTADEGNFKMQEELANMFRKNMNFENLQYQQPELDIQTAVAPPAPALGYSSSQHYYPPPAHLAATTIADHLPQETEADIKNMLLQHNVDPSHLLTSQLNLFTQAAPEQRERLVELWRISPMEQVRNDGLGGWKDTSLEQEEDLARTRLARRMAEESSSSSTPGDMDMGSQGGEVEPHQFAEPYVKSGYEALAERDYNKQDFSHLKGEGACVPLSSDSGYQQALDPAFSSKEWWRDFTVKQPMEFQYGMFDFRPTENHLGHQEDDDML